MPRYGFTSPGAQAGDAIQKFLVERALAQRQAEIDAQAQQEKQRAAEQQAAELKLRQQQEARVAQAQTATIADLENQRQFTRASTIADRALPGDPVDDPTRQLLTAQGFGGQVQKTPGILVPMLGSAPGSDAQIQPDSYAMRGGTQYLSARATADERAAQAKTAAEEHAAQAEATRAAAAERADADRAMRREIAGMGQAGAAETRGLRNDLLKTQIAAAEQKQTDAKTADVNKRNAIKQPAQEALALIDELVAPTGELQPGVSGAVGARIGMGMISGSPEATAISKIDRLKALLDIDLISQMKAQSRTGATGFGSMSAPELKILEDAAARLGRNQSEASFKEELTRLRTKLQQVVAEPETTRAGPGGGADAAARAKALIDKYAR